MAPSCSPPTPSHFYENIEDDKPYAILTDLPAMYAAFDRLNELAGADGVVVPGHDPLVRQRHEVLARSGGLVTVLRPPGGVNSLNMQRHADVVVVGGGNAGFCAAHAAAERGRQRS